MRVIFALLAVLLVFPLCAQNSNDFVFARLEYPGLRDNTYIKNWYTDYPEADEHITVLLNRLTGIRATNIKVGLTESIYGYPFIYIVEPAQAHLEDSHILLLREYLDRGGFIVMDDIHGDDDFLPVKIIIGRLFPENSGLTELDISHEIFHIYYDIPEIIQVVNDGIAMCLTCTPLWENGPSGEIPAVLAHYSAGKQDAKRIDVVVFYNNDLGDAVEWIDHQSYPRYMSVFAVKIIVNTVIFSMTH